MKRSAPLITLFFFSLLFSFTKAKAQCEPIAEACEPHIEGYISDGQSYRALLRGEEVAEFRTTLFEGTTYRLAACSDTTGENLIFKVRDKERNLLFSNAEHGASPYWDFKVPNTMDCIIEAQLDPSAGKSSGCAVLLVSFKE